jgi:hypothetical protein
MYCFEKQSSFGREARPASQLHFAANVELFLVPTRDVLV